MIIEWARKGTHSPMEIFREARRIPALRHAVRAAPRDWWCNAVKEVGNPRWVARTRRKLTNHRWGQNTYDVPAWELLCPTLGASQYFERLFMQRVVEASAGESAEMWFAKPHDVFSLAATQWGLVCHSCGAINKKVRYHRWKFDHWHLCQRCGRKRRGETDLHVVVRLMQKEIKEIARNERAA